MTTFLYPYCHCIVCQLYSETCLLQNSMFSHCSARKYMAIIITQTYTFQMFGYLHCKYYGCSFL
jgi:hypothetical protein